MRRDWFEILIAVGASLGLVACVAIVIALGVRDCNDQRRCTNAGGRVEKYNCSTVLIPVSCGSGCTMFVPTESCEWRCVGAAPEKPQ